MWSKLSKNGIVKGHMESYCLVCECLVGNVDKIDKHVEDPYHVKRLCMYPHLEKYTKDRIRKIEGVYFCELCGITVSAAAKVNAHISTKEHFNNRELLQLTAGPDSGVVAFNEVLISEDTWHAIGENCCSFCDEVDVDPKHIHSRNHLLKLLQSKIEFLENGLYRKIDENTIQCLTCNIMFEMNLINNHFDSKDHKIAYTKCKIGHDNLNNTLRTENISRVKDKAEDSKSNDNPENVVSEVNAKESKVNDKQDNAVSEVNIKENKVNDDQDNVVSEVKAEDSKVNDDRENVVSKIEENKMNSDTENVVSEVKAQDSKAKDDTENVVSEVKAEDSKANDDNLKNVMSEAEVKEIKDFSNNHEITYNLVDDTAYCRVCEISIPPLLPSMKEHVTENKHAEKLKFYKPILKRELLKAFAEQLNLVETGWSYDVVINNKICIKFTSFFFVCGSLFERTCFCCRTLNDLTLQKHVMTLHHKKAVYESPVVTTFADEFLREFRPGVFHCGFCNDCHNWINIPLHLQSSGHKSKKEESKYRLSLITSQLQEDNYRLQSERIKNFINTSLEKLTEAKLYY